MLSFFFSLLIVRKQYHYCYSSLFVQSTLFIPTLDTTTKFVIMTILLSRNLRLSGNNKSQIMQEYCIWYFKETYVLDLSESPHKYPKHMFYEKIWIKQGLPHISFCLLRILLVQQQIHYIGNIFENKFCHCNEGCLYVCDCSFLVSYADSASRRMWVVIVVSPEYFYLCGLCHANMDYPDQTAHPLRMKTSCLAIRTTEPHNSVSEN